MLSERIHLPGVDDDQNALLNHLLARLEAREPVNFLRASYYDGKRAIKQVGTIIPPQYYKLGITLGWSAKAVDNLARRCNLDSFVWPDGDLDSLGFKDVAQANHLTTEVSSATISSLIHGPSFLVNTRGDESMGEPAGLIHVKDAFSATGEWNPRTRGLSSLLSITGRDDDGRVRSLALYLDGLTITADNEGGAWTVDKSEHTFGVPAEVLAYKPRVGHPFGASRITRSVMSIQDRASRIVIRMEGHADVFSFPEMWMLGADNGIFRNEDGSMKADWQVMLGRIKGIPDDPDRVGDPLSRVDVKQFPAASPQPHLDMYKRAAMDFAGETDLPASALGVQADTNTTTADGSDNAERQLIAEAEGATDDWTPALARSVRRALAMANGLPGIPREWATIAPKWRSPVYLSRAAQADAGMKQLSAIPWLAETEVGLELLGLDEQQIQRALAEKRRAQGSLALQAIAEAAAKNQPVIPSANVDNAAG